MSTINLEQPAVQDTIESPVSNVESTTVIKSLDFSKLASNRTVAKRDFREESRKITSFDKDVIQTMPNGTKLQRYTFRVEGVNYRFSVLGNAIKNGVEPSKMIGSTITFEGTYSTPTSEGVVYANVKSLEVIKLSKLAQLGLAGVSVNITADLFD